MRTQSSSSFKLTAAALRLIAQSVCQAWKAYDPLEPTELRHHDEETQRNQSRPAARCNCERERGAPPPLWLWRARADEVNGDRAFSSADPWQ